MIHMRGKEAIEWEKRLQKLCNQIDRRLEKEYKNRFSLHPARPPSGTTANPEMDGLFNVGASFSAGFGSPFGAGYVLEIRLSTLEAVPKKLREEFLKRTHALLQEGLPNIFPGKHLKVSREGSRLRIHGDLSLN